MIGLVALVVAVVALGALYELYIALQKMGVRPSIGTGTLGLIALFVVAASNAPVLAVMGVVNVYILVSLAQHLIRSSDRSGALVDWAFSLSALLYVGFTMVHVVLLMRLNGTVGLAWIGVALAATLATGVVALFLRQESKLWRLIALAAGTAAGGLTGYLLGVPLSVGGLILCGGVISGGAMLGRHCEAFVKRQLGANPLVSSIPGRGGLLARSAALRSAMPVTFYLASLPQWQTWFS